MLLASLPMIDGIFTIRRIVTRFHRARMIANSVQLKSTIPVLVSNHKLFHIQYVGKVDERSLFFTSADASKSAASENRQKIISAAPVTVPQPIDQSTNRRLPFEMDDQQRRQHSYI